MISNKSFIAFAKATIPCVQKTILIFIFCIIAHSAGAAPVIKLTATPGNCPANGTITVNATGTSGTVFYAIKKTSDLTFSTQQASPIFPNLETGTYVVAVYDASGTTLSNSVSLTNAIYTPVVINRRTPGNLDVTGCDDDGSIEVVITNNTGTPPFTFQLKDGPTSRPDVVISTRTARFTQLSTGTYSIDVKDACGNITAIPNISVTSLYNISSYDLKSFELQAPALTSTTGCNLRMTFPSNNSVLTAEDGTVLFWRSPAPSKYIPSNYPLTMKIEYPSGSGQFLSDWHTINPNLGDTIPYYYPTTAPKSNKYRILVKHPCNPSDTVFSSEYTIPNPYSSRNGACAPFIERLIPTYDCGQVTIKITNKSNPAMTQTYVWNDSNSTYPLDVSGLAAGKYSVSITTAGGYTYSSTDVDIGTLPTINTAYIYNYISTLGCDFTTGGFRVYGIAGNDTITKTYSIISGPVTRPPISGAADMNLWTDLPAGTYQVKIQYGTCGSVTKTLNLVMPYNGFESSPLSYISSSTCGQYHITGTAWYLAPNNSHSSTGTYAANVFNSSGVFLSYVSATSDGQFTTAALPPGTYRISFQSSSHSQNICYYTQADQYITIPPYIPLGIDVNNSGGTVCSNGFGVLHIDTIGGSGQAVMYRIKPKGSPDSAYTPYQASPDFPGLLAGDFTTQAMDSCGYTTAQDLTLVASGTHARFDISGADTTGGLARACEGEYVIIKLLVTGVPANSIIWENPNGAVVHSREDTIPDFSAADGGYYVVTYDAGGCTKTDSVMVYFNAKPIFTFADSATCESSVDLTNLRLLSGSTVGFALTYFDDSYTPLLSTIVSSSGIYYIRGLNSTGCMDTTSVTITFNPKPEFAYADSTSCDPSIDLANLTLQSGSVAGLAFTYYDNTYTPLLSTIVSSGGNYHIIGTTGTGCTDTSSVKITINPKPEFVYADSTTCDPGIDLANLSLKSGSVTGLTLAYYDSIYTPLLSSIVSSSGTYHIIGTNGTGCTDTSSVLITINPKPEFAYADSTTCDPSIDLANLRLLSGSISGLTLAYYDNIYTPLLSTIISSGGTYHIIGTNGSGCTDTSTVVMIINPKPEFAYADSTTCTPSIDLANLSLQSGSISGLTFTYYDNVYTPLLSTIVSSSGTYHIIGTTGTGCTDTSSVIITINPKPEFTYADSTTCVPGIDLSNLNLLSGSISGLTLAYYDNQYTPLLSSIVSSSGTYHIIGTNGTGCTDTSSVKITINPKPEFAYADSTTCDPGIDLASLSLKSGSVTGLTFTYYDNAYTPLLSTIVSSSGTYHIIGTTGTGCTDTSSVIITINPKPEFAYADSTTCAPGIDLANLNLLSGSISGLTLAYYDNAYTPLLSTIISSSGTYHIIGTNGSGCTDTSSVIITINPKPEFAYADSATCAPANIDLTNLNLLSGSVTGLTLAYYDDTYTALLSTIISSSGTFHIIGTNNSGCTDTSSVIITIDPPVQVDSITGNNVICESTSTQLANTTPGGIWTSSNPQVASVSTNGSVTGLNAGTAFINYTVGSHGCSDSAQIQITVKPSPIADFYFIPEDTTVYSFHNQTIIPGGQAIDSWDWSYGDGKNSTSQNPKHRYPGNGTYTVYLTAKLTNGCSSQRERTVLIGQSFANFYVTDPSQCFSGNVFYFTNTSKVILPNTLKGYLWDFGDGKASTEINPVHSYSEGGTYTVQLILKGSISNDTIFQDVKVYEAKVNKPFDQIVCNGSRTNEVVLQGTADIYTWTGGSSIGLPDGENNYAIPSFIATSDNNVRTTEIIYVTPRITTSNLVCYGDSTSFSITVNPASAPTITGDSLISCGSSSKTYFTESGMHNYKWSVTGGDVMAGGTSKDNYVTINWGNNVDSGYVSVGYTDLNGCQAAIPAEKNIEFHSDISIVDEPASSQTVCEGGLLELGVLATGAELKYQWYFNNQPLQGENNPVYLVPSSNKSNEGYYYAKIYNSCDTSYTNTVNVRVNNLSIIVQKWNNVLAVKCLPEDNGGYEFTDFQWYKNGDILPEETKSYLHISGDIDYSAIYVVRVTTVSGDVFFTCGQKFVQKNNSAIQVYPNPVKKGNTLFIDIDSDDQPLKYEYLLINSMGHRVIKQTSDQKKLELTLSVNGGVYVLLINMNNGRSSEVKIIVTE